MSAKPQHPLLLALGARVRTLRQAQGFSQDDLASRAGLHRTYVGGVERGERNVSLLNLAKLASALDVPLPSLLEFTGSEE